MSHANKDDLQEFTLDVYERLFPQGNAFVCSDWEVRVESPNGEWMQVSIGAVVSRYRPDNLGFADQQTVDELDSQRLWIPDERAPLLPTFRKPKPTVS